jgi:hypothetical protein
MITITSQMIRPERIDCEQDYIDASGSPALERRSVQEENEGENDDYGGSPYDSAQSHMAVSDDVIV